MSPLIAVVGDLDAASREGLGRLIMERIADAELSDRRTWQKLDVRPDLVIVGASYEPGPALSTIRSVRRDFPDVPIVLITTRGSENLAVACLRLAIQDYFQAPFEWEEILGALEQLLPKAVSEAIRLVDEQRFIGSSETIQAVKRSIVRIAPAESNVLITGETGTGKEVVADLIHKNSHRANAPFVGINCAAIPDGLLESELFGYERGAFTGASTRQSGKLRLASGGTAFLDEIGEMSLASQAKLLRVVETRQIYPLGSDSPLAIDIRFIAATNQQLEMLVDERRFRSDLFFRLNVGRIQLRPLRERRSDIPEMANKFVRDFNRIFGRRIAGFSPPAMDVLIRHSWPGNVRELRNVVEASFLAASGDRLEVFDLPDGLRDTQRQFEGTSERDRLVAALISAHWNKSEAARLLQWSRMTIYRKMLKYGLADDATVTDDDRL